MRESGNQSRKLFLNLGRENRLKKERLEWFCEETMNKSDLIDALSEREDLTKTKLAW